MRRCAPVVLLSLTCSVAAAQERVEERIARGFTAIHSWQLDEARGITEEALQEAPSDPLTLALLADMKMHMSDYRGAVQLFDDARKSGAPEELLRNEHFAKAALLATNDFVEEVSEHFILRHQPGRDAILVPYALETLEQARERIGELLGWKPQGRIVVELYPSAKTLAAVSSLTNKDIENSGTIALCRWNRLMATTPRAVVFGYTWRDTLAHELVHLIIGGASHNTVPIWLHEGIAKYTETAWSAEPGLGLSEEQQRRLQTAARKNRLIPFAKMHPSMAKLKTQEEASLAFAEVFTFIEFLVDKKGYDGIRQVLQEMAGGATDAQAIQRVYGESLSALSKKWMASLKTRKVGAGRGTDRKVVLKERPSAPDDKLHGVSKKGRRFARAADLLYARGRLKAASKELQKAYKITKSPLISAKLAMVAQAANDLPTAEKAARDAIGGSPDLAGPRITLAQILHQLDQKEEALNVLERAVDINPLDPRIHHLMLRLTEPNSDARLRAERTIRILKNDRSPSVLSLGHGSTIRIAGPPFSRVYLRRQSDMAQQVPTAHLTPTVPITIRPGMYELTLVPPAGPPTNHVIEVHPSPDAAPQEITISTTGS